MSQNQEQIEARLAAYVDGELDATQRAEIEKHLASNPAHKKLIHELLGQRDLVKALPHEKAPPEIYEQLQGQLERSVLLGAAGESDAPMGISRWPHRGAIAAIVLLTAGLGFLVYKVLPSNKPPGEFVMAPKETGPVPATMATNELAKSDGEKTFEATAGKGGAEEADKGKALAFGDSSTTARSMAKTGGELNQIALSSAAPAAKSAASGVPTGGPAPSAPASEPLSINAPPQAPEPTVPPADDKNQSIAGQVAMNPPAASNSLGVTEQPVMNAMNSAAAPVTAPPAVLAPEALGTTTESQAKQSQSLDALAGATNGAKYQIVVSTDDPGTTRAQVKTYLTDNGITWEPAPALAASETETRQIVQMNRLRSRNVDVTRDTQFAKVLPNDRYRYPAKDVAPDRRAEAEAIAQKPTFDESKQQSTLKIESAATTMPSNLADVTAAQANVAAAEPQAAATTQPEPGGQGQQEAAVEPTAFYCRDITPAQARELETVLASRPGQAAQLLAAPSITAATTQPMELNAIVVPTTQPQSPLVTDQVQAQLNQPAAQDLTLQQQAAIPAPGQQQSLETRIDVTILVQPQPAAATQPASAPSTQP